MISLPISALLALAFTSSASSSVAQPGVIHVPVVRSGLPSGLQNKLRRKASTKYASVDLQNLQSIYSVNISIAGQPTSVVLDTGSFELWVDPNCDTASRSGDEAGSDESSAADSDFSSPSYCESIGRYDPSSSSTAEALDEGNVFQYADTTTIEVNYYTDTIDIGGLTITKQQFGVANVTNATALGIMGLGPNSVYGYNMTAGTYSYILDSLASQGQIASRAFSLDLRDYDNSTGALIFGGLDNKKFSGSLQSLPLETVEMTVDQTKFTDYGQVFQLSFGLYYVTVPSVGITKPNTTSSSKYSQASFLAVLDSGTSIILTPRGLSSQICNDVGGTQTTQDGVTICYFTDCSVRKQTGGLDFNFEGKTIQVAYENLVTEVVENGVSYCFLGVSDTTVDTDPPTYILGDPFLRASYAVFDWDNQQVHLAQADDCGSNIVAIGSGTGAVPAGSGCKESSSMASARWSTGLMICVAFMAMGVTL